MSHEPYSEMAPAYALGSLEGEERSRFEAHLREGCAECERALVEYGEGLAALVAGLPPVAPPPSVKAALVRRIAGAARPSPPRERPGFRLVPWRVVWAGALAAALVVVGYLALRINALERELGRRAEELTTLRAQVAQQREFLTILLSPETQLVSLGGLKPSPAARGRVWWQSGEGGFFVANGLPVVPAGKTYQLWAIAGGKPVSAGIFAVGPEGSGRLSIKPLPGVGKVEMFAVTLEPAGGLPQPTGEMYLAGKVS